MKSVGAHFRKSETVFTVWAPEVESLSLRLFQGNTTIRMTKDSCGYFSSLVKNCPPGERYAFVFPDGAELPDPASFFQPEGVHKPSQVIDHAEFSWNDGNWKGIPLDRMVIYETHVGTFTSEGTFEAIVPRLSDLAELGVNAIEIMPVSQFPGTRNWGYDGVHPFAVQNSYGGPAGLKALVDRSHSKGIAVVLDVVYNHLGPEGNYFGRFGPYFTDRYKTPWGSAINYDGPSSDEVRGFFIQNALYWFEYFHIDALRLDAIHSIFDFGAKHFLGELSDEVEKLSKRLGRKLLLIAESDLSDTRVIDPPETGGYGIDSQWCDDFHHLVHTLLTNEKAGYYEDFTRFDQIVKHLQEGFVYSGDYSPHRQRRFGSSSKGRHGRQFVICCQNHDQVGNRMLGERLTRLVSFDALKLAAGLLFLSPSVPLLFMGEEYGEDAPFLYFVSHGDEPLIKAVRAGRKREFKAFSWKGTPPDPQSETTFSKSKLRWESRKQGNHGALLAFYKALISARREIAALISLDRSEMIVTTVEGRKILTMTRWHGESRVWCIFSFEPVAFEIPVALPSGNWKKILDSCDSVWAGKGSQLPLVMAETASVVLQPFHCAMYVKEKSE